MNILIPKKDIDYLLSVLPNTKEKKTGRPKSPKHLLVKGIVIYLKYQIPWNSISFKGCSGISCWRYFNELQRRGNLQQIFDTITFNYKSCNNYSSDSSTITSFRHKYCTGWDGKHKKIGTKVSLITNNNGIPLHLEISRGNTHDLRLLTKHLDKSVLKTHSTINLDKGYTSAALRRDLKKHKIRVNMETRKNDYIHKRGPKFKLDEDKYKSRFLVERVSAWLKSFSALRVRKTKKIANFRALVLLALILTVKRMSEF